MRFRHMCSLFGISAETAINPANILQSFFPFSNENRDGIGLGYYNHKKAVIHKQAKAAHESSLAQKLLHDNEMKSNTFIGHLRNASPGFQINYNNTHPWKRECIGNEYIFCLNGSMSGKDFPNIKLSSFFPEGSLPAEMLFCYFLEYVQKQLIREWNVDDFKWAHSFFSEINKYCCLNVLLASPDWLMAFHDKDGYNGLFYTNQKFLSNDSSISTSAEGFMIASQPLTFNQEWKEFEPGEMKVFQSGKESYSVISSTESEFLVRIS